MLGLQDLEERLQFASHKAYEAETRAEAASLALSTVRSKCVPAHCSSSHLVYQTPLHIADDLSACAMHAG